MTNYGTGGISGQHRPNRPLNNNIISASLSRALASLEHQYYELISHQAAGGQVQDFSRCSEVQNISGTDSRVASILYIAVLANIRNLAHLNNAVWSDFVSV